MCGVMMAWKCVTVLFVYCRLQSIPAEQSSFQVRYVEKEKSLQFYASIGQKHDEAQNPEVNISDCSKNHETKTW